MQTSPHDEGWRWLFALCVPLFAGGVAWLVRHFLGRETAVVQLNLANAQTDEIRARIRRDDETAAVANLKAAADVLREDAQRFRDERNKAEGEVRLLELQLEREVRWRKANGWPEPPGE